MKFSHNKDEVTERLESQKFPHSVSHTIELYLFSQYDPGKGLKAILSNDLFDAVSYCDDMTIENLAKIVRFFHNYTPSFCWGTKEKVDAWLDGEAGYPENWT